MITQTPFLPGLRVGRVRRRLWDFWVGTRVAVWRRMNALFFAVRRADLAIFRHVRRLILRYGLTPARFDLMFTLLHGARHQTELAQILGVSAPVISRMLRSLVDLGLVKRYR